MQIKAMDEIGNLFYKPISLIQTPEGLVVDLGFPNRYYVSDIRNAHLGIADKFYIDAMGRNHKGHPTYLSYQELLYRIDILESKLL